MTNDQIIQSSLDRLSEAINKELASIPSDALGDVLANLTLNLFRVCESELVLSACVTRLRAKSPRYSTDDAR